MVKRLCAAVGTLILALGTVPEIQAQIYAGPTSTRIVGYSAAPATCHEGDKYYNLTSHTEWVCTAANTWTQNTTGAGASAPFSDATAIVKNAADATKLIQFDASGVTTGNTVLYTFTGTAAAAGWGLPAPAAAASTTAGNALSIFASNATAGTTNAGAAAGGNVTITAGNAAQKTSGNANGGDVVVTPGTGVGTGRIGMLQVGSGSTTAEGWYLGNYASGYSGLWTTAVAPSTTNYVLAVASAGSTYFNVQTSGGALNIRHSNVDTVGILATAFKLASNYAFGFTSGDSTATMDTNLSRVASGVIGIGTGTAASVAGNVRATYYETVVGGNVASATTITPTGGIFHVTGTTQITTIVLPRTGFTGCVRLIPDGLFTTATGGNIALGSTAVVSKVLEMCYDGTSWYPSY